MRLRIKGNHIKEKKYGIQTNNTHDTIYSYPSFKPRKDLHIYYFQLKCQVMEIEGQNKKECIQHCPHPS